MRRYFVIVAILILLLASSAHASDTAVIVSPYGLAIQYDQSVSGSLGLGFVIDTINFISDSDVKTDGLSARARGSYRLSSEFTAWAEAGVANHKGTREVPYVDEEGQNRTRTETVFEGTKATAGVGIDGFLPLGERLALRATAGAFRYFDDTRVVGTASIMYNTGSSRWPVYVAAGYRTVSQDDDHEPDSWILGLITQW